MFPSGAPVLLPHLRNAPVASFAELFSHYPLLHSHLTNNQTVSQMESKKNEIDQLKQQANQLNQELLDIMNRIRQLELKATETPNKNE